MTPEDQARVDAVTAKLEGRVIPGTRFKSGTGNVWIATKEKRRGEWECKQESLFEHESTTTAEFILNHLV